MLNYLLSLLSCSQSLLFTPPFLPFNDIFSGMKQLKCESVHSNTLCCWWRALTSPSTYECCPSLSASPASPSDCPAFTPAPVFLPPLPRLDTLPRFSPVRSLSPPVRQSSGKLTFSPFFPSSSRRHRQVRPPSLECHRRPRLRSHRMRQRRLRRRHRLQLASRPFVFFLLFFLFFLLLIRSLSTVSGLSTLFTWGSICLCHIRFRAAWKYNGHSLEELPFRAMGGVYGSWCGLLLVALVLIAQFYIAVWPLGGASAGADAAESFFLVWLGKFFFFFSFLLTVSSHSRSYPPLLLALRLPQESYSSQACSRDRHRRASRLFSPFFATVLTISSVPTRRLAASRG
jgi:hypothetical protein